MRRTSSPRRTRRRSRVSPTPPPSSPTAVAPATSTATRRSPPLQEVCPDRIIECRMRRSIADGRLCRLALILLAALGARGAFAQLPTSGPARLVNVIEVNDHEDQVDLTMVFNCSMRFITSLPASEGRQVHIQLAPMPDCGVSQLSQLLAETPPVSGGANIINSPRALYHPPAQNTLPVDVKKGGRFALARRVAAGGGDGVRAAGY